MGKPASESQISPSGPATTRCGQLRPEAKVERVPPGVNRQMTPLPTPTPPSNPVTRTLPNSSRAIPPVRSRPEAKVLTLPLADTCMILLIGLDSGPQQAAIAT